MESKEDSTLAEYPVAHHANEVEFVEPTGERKAALGTVADQTDMFRMGKEQKFRVRISITSEYDVNDFNSATSPFSPSLASVPSCCRHGSLKSDLPSLACRMEEPPD
jgi:hypothetical protein